MVIELFAGLEALEDHVALQVGEPRDADVEELLERRLEREASQVDDPAPGDELVEPHGGTRRLALPLKGALLDLVDEPEGQDEDEEQDGPEDRDVLVEEFAVDEHPGQRITISRSKSMKRSAVT